MDWMPNAIRDGIMVVLMISGPIVIAAATIGLVVGILQAATQVQEQTIGTAVKIIGVFGLLIISGFWMFQYLNQYMNRTITSAFTFVPRRSQKVIPSDAYIKASGKKGFENGINAESFNAPIMVIEPERIENKLPTGGGPPGSSILGAPQIPKAPIFKNSIPEQPRLGENIVEPQNENANDLDESLKLIPQKLNNFIEDGAMTEPEPEDMQLINRVPEEENPTWLN